MRVSLLISLVIAFIIACTSVHGIKESDLSGFSVNVPASDSNINSDNSNNMIVKISEVLVSDLFIFLKFDLYY